MLIAMMVFLCAIHAQTIPPCPKNFVKSSVSTVNLTSEFYGQTTATKRIFLNGNFTTNSSSHEELLILTAQGTSNFHAGLWSYCSSYNTMTKVWNQSTSTGSPTTFEFWNINVNVDKYCVGDFNADGKDDILCINPSNGWAQLASYILNNDYCNGAVPGNSRYDWDNLWGNAGNGKITHWYFNSNDNLFAGDFDGSPGDELLITNPSGWATLYKYSGGTWNYLWGSSPSTPNFEGSFPTSAITTKGSAVGKFGNLPTGLSPERDMIFLSNPSTGNYVIAYFDSGAFYPYFRSCSTKTIGGKAIQNEDYFFVGQFDADGKNELIRYNRKWRYDMTTSDFVGGGWDFNCGSSNFVTNGKVDYKGYPSNQNPKYFENFTPIFGNFTSSGQTSLLLLYKNNNSAYTWGENFNLFNVETGSGNWLVGDESTEQQLSDRNAERKLLEQPNKQESQTTENGFFKIYPNPLSGNTLNIAFIAHTAGRYDIKVMDNLGKLVYSHRLSCDAGKNALNLELPASLSKGVYFLRMSNLTQSHVSKFIKNN